MKRLYVWDPLVRLFHWSLVLAFLANAFVTRPGKEVHQWVGYGVAALIALRLVWGLIGPRHARFSDFLPSPSGAIAQLREMATGRREAHAGHSPLGALMIYNLLLTMAAIALTGWMQTTVAYFGVEWVAQVHEALVTWAELCALAHVAAVVLESRRLRVNLPKSMVTGYKEFVQE
ncbi:cytochrome b/b6 domain-containing protein [Fuscibacter oryzae]|uniref:Cytochrome b/b6 domain-containing protein n=1 Tax=Fuscibacter oryzae TaxID=2803939 RepID=A0A8J7MTC6_9RHOB|nr:cytochrome b/b6 domain-containing protein [Fuscibacter oryzae]MBL4929216.1 cytochrome b/b6 domain-containing protein [Fuscibacter oryzae]